MLLATHNQTNLRQGKQKKPNKIEQQHNTNHEIDTYIFIIYLDIDQSINQSIGKVDRIYYLLIGNYLLISRFRSGDEEIEALVLGTCAWVRGGVVGGTFGERGKDYQISDSNL